MKPKPLNKSEDEFAKTVNFGVFVHQVFVWRIARRHRHLQQQPPIRRSFVCPGTPVPPLRDGRDKA